MSIIEKAINKLETEKGRDALLDSPRKTHPQQEHPLREPDLGVALEPPVYSAVDVQQNPPSAAGEAASKQAEVLLAPELEDDAGPHEAASTGCVHVLPLNEMDAMGLITPHRPRSPIADEFRAIKRPLLMNIEQKGASVVENANLIMVTSALPGEGKTFSAINLAMSMATEQDRTVLLVDADVTKASAAHILGIDDDCPGLIDLLEDDTKKFSDVLIHTSIPKLRILPAGHLHEHATELLASDKMKNLVRELSMRYPDRVIIFDSPPLLITTEASVLANHVGQVVFVVASQQSSQDAVAEAIEHLGDDKIIGLVLNKVRKNPLSKHGYGYGYGYGNGYGYGEGARRERHYKYSEKEK